MKGKFEYWFGDTGSEDAYHTAMVVSANPELYVRSDRRPVDEDNHLLTKYGSTAVINISGSLLPFSNWITRTMGMTGYPDIRNALVTAHEDDGVEQIVLNIDSPGGSANGIEDISNLMARIDKPMVAFTSGTMASAAYWIGASADKIFATRLSNVGSIGVIATHFDLTKRLEDEGVKATVFRSGEYKALGGPNEPLTAKAKEIIQGKLDTLYEAFVSHVAEMRGTTTKIVHDKMADGREFFGYQAVEAGLVDGLTTLDDLIASFNTQKRPRGRTTTRMEASEMKKKLLNERTVALLEAGASVDEALQTAPDVAEGGATTEPEATEAEAAAAAAAEAEASATTEATTEPAQGSTESADLVSYLKAELNASNDKVLSVTMENRELQTRLNAMNTTHASMREVVVEVTRTRQIALHGSSMDLSLLSDEALMQQYQATSAEFRTQFPIGGKAQLPSTTATQASAPAASQASRIKAVQL